MTDSDFANYSGKQMISELFGIPYEKIDSLMMKKATPTCPALYYYCPFNYVAIKSARALPKNLYGDPQYWQKVCSKNGRTIWRCLDGNKFRENTHFDEIENAEWFVGPHKHPDAQTRYVKDKGNTKLNPFLEKMPPPGKDGEYGH